MNASLASASILLGRRNAICNIFAGLAAVAAGSASQAQTTQPAEEKPCTSPNQARTSIHYVLDFNASPERFHQAILDAKHFAEFSGMPATIDASAGGAFSMFGGLIQGRNIEIVANQRIVQAWRPASWAPGVYSVVHFEFKPGSAGTSLAFDHTGFPSGLYDHLDWGWKNRYWGPLKKYFA
ncbi:MAG TPA: SRPBCC family protein [Terracidiphilus sp.]|jgi:activator of HSP90 ATPase|nr:SRPBCC family protein [Terracidiphilus sp.]